MLLFFHGPYQGSPPKSSLGEKGSKSQFGTKARAGGWGGGDGKGTGWL
jgi:hypothetical protein